MAPTATLSRLLPLLGLAACQGWMAGPCEHVFKDPVLVVQLDVVGPLRPGIVALTDFRLNERSQPSPAYWTGAPAYRAQIQGDTLFCQATCGFSFDEGRYQFNASATGFDPRPVAVDARYQDFDGGCPSSNRGSTRITVTLTPASPLR